MSERLRVILLSLLWISLGGWIGALIFFSAVVAPTAFQVLPSKELAGQLVAPSLRALHLYGAVAGIGLALLTVALRRGRGLALLAITLSALCLISHFGVTAPMAELRSAMQGPGADPAAGERFAALHRLSVAIFGAVTLGTLALAVLHTRAEVRPPHV